MNILEDLKLSKKIIDTFKENSAALDNELPNLYQEAGESRKVVQYTVEYLKKDGTLEIAPLFNGIYVFHKDLEKMIPQEKDDESVGKFADLMNAKYKAFKEKYENNDFVAKMLLFAIDKIWKECFA